MAAEFPEGVLVEGAILPGFETVLTREALAFLADLHRRFDGRRLDLSAGWAHAMSPAWSLLLQANLSQRGRDSGAEAEPEMSGSTTFSLSPGASVALGHDDTLYGFVQRPVYQRVNGVQLVPQWSLALGWTHAF